MKSFTKPAVFIFLTIAFSSSLFAQNTATEAVNVTASLIKGISISNIGGGTVDFDEIVVTKSTQTPAVAPASGVKLEIAAHPGRDLKITFGTATLNNTDRAGSITFTPNIEHTGTSDTYGSGTTVNNNNAITAADVSGIGMLYLWVGGSIEIPADQSHGNYAGTFNITVAY